jgi:hypothetical protein
VRLRFKEHIRYTTSDNQQSAYVIHIVHTAHEYALTETAVALIHSAEKGKRIITLESYYIQLFHQHNMIIRKQTQIEKNPCSD